jgi:hypothetical protein
MYNHINSLESQHYRRFHVRKVLNSFGIEGPDGEHIWLVYEALEINLEELRELVGEVFAPDFVRENLRYISRGMQFLHEEARVIHTGWLYIPLDLAPVGSKGDRHTAQKYHVRHP